MFAELHMQMRTAEVPIEQWYQLLGVDELNAIVAAKMAVLVVVLAGIAHRVASSE